MPLTIKIKEFSSAKISMFQMIKKNMERKEL